MAAASALSADVAEELDVESHAPYMKVWAILALLTLGEYFYAMIFKDHFPLLVSGLVSLALIKAGMVGWYFMHLKFERKWVFLLIIPACIMAIFLTLMLTPDMAMKPGDIETGSEDESWVAPAEGLRTGTVAPPALLAACTAETHAACQG